MEEHHREETHTFTRIKGYGVYEIPYCKLRMVHAHYSFERDFFTTTSDLSDRTKPTTCVLT